MKLSAKSFLYVLFLILLSTSNAHALLKGAPTGSNGGGAPSGPAGGDLAGTYPNPTVNSLANVTTGLPTTQQSPLFNLNGSFAAVGTANQTRAFNPVGTFSTSVGFVTPLSQAATNLFYLSGELIIDPHEQGAQCNTIHLVTGSTTNGSGTICSSSYNFVNADIGKKAAAGYALTTSTITGISGVCAVTNGTATATTSGNDLTFGTDDSSAIFNAEQFLAFYSGGYLIAPNNCGIANLQVYPGVSIIGASVGQSYGYTNEYGSPVWWVIGSGEDNDPTTGIDITRASASGIRGVELYGPAFPYSSVDNAGGVAGFSKGTVGIGCDGNTHGNGWCTAANSNTAYVLEDMTIENFMVGYGRSPGHTGAYIPATIRNSSFVHNGAATYGPISDFDMLGNDFTNNFFASIYLGPSLGAASSAETGTIVDTHDEYSGYGLVCDGCQNITVADMKSDHNSGGDFLFRHGWNEVSINGGLLGGGASSSLGATTSWGPSDAEFNFNANSTNTTFGNPTLTINGAMLHTRGSGGSVGAYLFDSDSAFAANTSISVNGGKVGSSFLTALTNWRVSAPAQLLIHAGDQPYQNQIAGTAYYLPLVTTSSAPAPGYVLQSTTTGQPYTSWAVQASGVTWPSTGSIVVSNSTNSPAGLPEVDGSCAVGVSGSWATGSCGSGSGVTLSDTTSNQTFYLGLTTTTAGSLSNLFGHSNLTANPSTGNLTALALSTSSLTATGTTSLATTNISNVGTFATSGTMNIQVNGNSWQIGTGGGGNGVLTSNSTITFQPGAVTHGQFTTSGLTITGSVSISNAMALTSTAASGPTNGAYLSAANTLDWTTSGAKALEISNTKHLSYQGTAPAVSACGTSPSIDANATDSSGMVTVGTVAAASCTVTFNNAYTSFNHCRVTPQTALATFGYTYSLSAITVTATSLLTEVFDYTCDGK